LIFEAAASNSGVGAYDVAVDNFYDNPDMRYFTADVEKFDTSTKAFFTMMYIVGNKVYYDLSRLTEPQKKQFLSALRLCAEHFSAKITHVHGTEWVIVIGVIPSGDKDTSSSGSWILAVHFLLVCSSSRNASSRI